MADSVRPQLEKIRHLLDGLTSEAPDFVRRLGSACVLNAYIKRHSNLMLLAEKETTVNAAELGLCIRESMDYLTACGVLYSFQQSGTGYIPLQPLCRAYETFEDVVESALPELRALLVHLSLEDGIWTLRIVMDGPAAVPCSSVEAQSGRSGAAYCCSAAISYSNCNFVWRAICFTAPLCPFGVKPPPPHCCCLWLC